MQSASDWLYLLGFLFLLVGIFASVFLYLPWPGRASDSDSTVQTSELTIAQWAELADRHEGYAPGHARRVALLAGRLAEAIALPEACRASLELACLLHDVGMLEIERGLLDQPGLLDQQDLFKLWRHSALGAKRALALTKDTAVEQWVRWHHERWDGLGYPDGLEGGRIPLPARILRLADSADALLHARPYRPAFSGEETITELNRLSGISYDPDLARIFVDYVLPIYLAEQAGAPPDVSPI